MYLLTVEMQVFFIATSNLLEEKDTLHFKYEYLLKLNLLGF